MDLTAPGGDVAEAGKQSVADLSGDNKRVKALEILVGDVLPRINQLEIAVNVKIPSSFCLYAEDNRRESCVACLYSLNASFADLEKQLQATLN